MWNVVTIAVGALIGYAVGWLIVVALILVVGATGTSYQLLDIQENRQFVQFGASALFAVIALYLKIKSTRVADELEAGEAQRALEARIKKASDLHATIVERVSRFENTYSREADKCQSSLDIAEGHLEAAEAAFRSRTFALFWEQAEDCAKWVRSHGGTIQRWRNEAILHQDQCDQLDDMRNDDGVRDEVDRSRRTLRLNPRVVSDVTPVANRLSALVLKAQSDYEFASIFEMRKSNELLVSLTQGIGSLSEAIIGMRNSVVDALSELAQVVDLSMNELAASSAAQSEILGEISSNLTKGMDERTQVLEDASSRISDKLDKQSGMLDNIQRDRKPFP